MSGHKESLHSSYVYHESEPIQRHYVGKFQLQEQFHQVLQEILEFGEEKKKGIDSRAISIQDHIAEIWSLTAQHSDLMQEVIEFQAQYIGFDPKDLITLHPNHYDKLNRHLAENNKKLRAIANGLVPRETGRIEKVEIDFQQRYRQLQDELDKLRHQNHQAIKDVEIQHEHRLEELKRSARDIRYRSKSMIPGNIHSLIMSTKFSTKQEDKVRNVKSTATEIKKKLQAFQRLLSGDQAMENVRELPSHEIFKLLREGGHHNKNNLAPEIQSYMNIHGKEFRDYHSEVINPNYPDQWQAVSRLVQRDCNELLDTKERIVLFFREHDYLLDMDPSYKTKFSELFQKKEKKDRKRKVSIDGSGGPFVWYSYQGRKRKFEYEPDFTVRDWKMELSKFLQIELSNMRLELKTNKSELQDTDKLAQYNGQHVKVIEHLR
jgi:hypothetical protein